jgi:outer membrane protein
MKRVLFMVLAVFFLIVLAAPSFAARPAKKGAGSTASLKVGIYDMQRIMKESKVIQGYRRILEKEVGEKRKVYTDKQESLKEMEEKLRKEGATMSLVERNQLGERLAQGLKELQRLREDLDIELQKKDRELGQRVIREISRVIQNTGEKGDFDIIFERSAAGVAYYNQTYDITKKIIQQYDAMK